MTAGHALRSALPLQPEGALTGWYTVRPAHPDDPAPLSVLLLYVLAHCLSRRRH